VRVVLVGPPGAGKGTQAQFVASHLSIPKISTGDIFRANVSEGTPLGKEARKYMEAGDLVPDEVTVGMVQDRLAEDDAQTGFLLDGFPRTVPQAEELERILDELDSRLDVVLELVVDDDEVVRRLSGRRVCRRCEHIWHVDFDPPAKEGICDHCGGELFQRDDDQAETVRHRLEVYYEQTAPVIGFYSERSLLVGIDAMGPVDDVTDRAIGALRRFAR
jgi:adenylate kinase